MMSMKTWMIVMLALIMMGLGFAPARGQDRLVTIQALMIQAQNESAPIDRRLEKVEYKLRRVFGFQFYRYVGEGSISLNPGGEGIIDLPDGHHLRVRLGGKGGGAEVHWIKDDNPLLSTSVSISRESPVVLGGIPANGGKLIVVLSTQ